MEYKLPNEVKIILDKFQNAGYQIYIVGGAVRDLLMGREVTDWDFTTDAKPEEILKVVPDGFYENKLIKCVGDPSKRFQEDALRLIRAIRIATQLEFDIEKKTFNAIKNNSDLIKEVANERIRDELLKLLGCMNPRLPSPSPDNATSLRAGSGEAIGGQAYMGILKLREVGLLQIILPELEKCFGIKQQGPKHERI